MHSGVMQFRPWTTILDLIFSPSGFIVGIVPVLKGDGSSAPSVYRYLTTLSQVRLDSVVNILASGRAVVVGSDTIIRADSTQLQSPNRGTFIFESPDSVNSHVFQVKAIDNNGAESILPAQVTLWTSKVTPPETNITGFPADSSYIINQVTDTFQGLQFTFQGRDVQSQSFEFSWTVDSVRWSAFSSAVTAKVTASDLRLPLSGLHRFYVRARNEFGVEDTTPAARTFLTIFPLFVDSLFPKRTLVINCTRDTGLAGCPTNASVNAFYQSVLDSLGRSGVYDLWTVRSQGWPRRDSVGFARYSTVFLICDFFAISNQTLINGYRADILRQYLNVGGKMIFSSWNLPGIFSPADNPFFTNYIHIVSPSFNPFNNSQDFVGSRGALGYPTVSLDTTKMPSSWQKALARLSVNPPTGFAEIIGRYDSKRDSLLFENQPIGIRYFGPPKTYSVVYFGFPLYFVSKSDAVGLIRKGFQDLGE